MKHILKLLLAGILVHATSCKKDDANPGSKVLAEFSADKTAIEQGRKISFTDQSSGEPSSWLWTFEGGNPSNSTEQNPVVSYSKVGEYDVSLTVKNLNSEDNKTIPGYITVEQVTIPEEFDIIGTWERVESNYLPLNGMRVSVNGAETEGKIVKSPSSTLTEGELKWKNMVKISEHEYKYDDLNTAGEYTKDWSIFIIAYGNELILGNFDASISGSFQRWQRVDFQYPEDEDYDLLATWSRTKSNNSKIDGMKVQVVGDQTQGKIIFSPDEGDFPLNALKWKEINKEGKNRFAFQDLVSDGSYSEARLFLTAKGKELVTGTFTTRPGSFQRWTRE